MALVALLGFRMMSHYGLWDNSPSFFMSFSTSEEIDNDDLTPPDFYIKAVMTMHCSKKFDLFGVKYVLPIVRDLNCSSTHWRGRNVRNIVCQEILEMENLEQDGDPDFDISDPSDHWRIETLTLTKLCGRISKEYILLQKKLFKLDRINGSWLNDEFDFECP